MILKYKCQILLKWKEDGAGELTSFAMQVFLIIFLEPVEKVGNSWLFANLIV